MSLGSGAVADAGRRPLPSLRALPTWAGPASVGVVLALLVSGTWRQLAHPFLEHDDWDFLLPVERPRTTSMWDRLLAEGRWFNYAWWRTIGHLLTPFTAMVLFSAAALALAAFVGWRWAPGWLAVPTIVAVYVSPMIVDLSPWPATIGPSIIMLAVAAAVLPRCLEGRRLTLWIGVSTVLVFLAYPPGTLFLLVLVVVELIDESLRDLLVAVGTFFASYVVGTLVVFTLNLIAFGKFGLEIRAWRKPNPLHGVGDLFTNLGRVCHHLTDMVENATIPMILGALAVGACVALPVLRERGLRLVGLIVVGLAIQSSATVLQGVITPFRSMGWIWLVVVVALVWLVQAVPVDRRVQVPALLALLAVCVWGARFWDGAIDHQQHNRAKYQRVLDRLEDQVHAHPDYTILVIGTSDDWRNPKFTQQAQYLAMKAENDHGTFMKNCLPPACGIALRPFVLQRADEGKQVFITTRFIVVIPPAHLDPS